jgi:hypothetical protein
MDVIPDDEIPRQFLRPRVGEDGFYVVDTARLPPRSAVSRIRANGVRPVWRHGSGYEVDVDGKIIPIVAELDLPNCDAAYQQWAAERREEHIRRGECTSSDLAQFYADRRFLVVRTYEAKDR